MSDLEKEEVRNYIEHLKDVKLQMAEDLMYEGANDGGYFASAQGKKPLKILRKQSLEWIRSSLNRRLILSMNARRRRI